MVVLVLLFLDLLGVAADGIELLQIMCAIHLVSEFNIVLVRNENAGAENISPRELGKGHYVHVLDLILDFLVLLINKHPTVLVCPLVDIAQLIQNRGHRVEVIKRLVDKAELPHLVLEFLATCLILIEPSLTRSLRYYFALALDDEKHAFGHLAAPDEVLSILIGLWNDIGRDPHQKSRVHVFEKWHSL